MSIVHFTRQQSHEVGLISVPTLPSRLLRLGKGPGGMPQRKARAHGVRLLLLGELGPARRAVGCREGPVQPKGPLLLCPLFSLTLRGEVSCCKPSGARGWMRPGAPVWLRQSTTTSMARERRTRPASPRRMRLPRVWSGEPMRQQGRGQQGGS